MQAHCRHRSSMRSRTPRRDPRSIQRVIDAMPALTHARGTARTIWQDGHELRS